MVQPRWSTVQWAMQTFRQHKMGHGSEKVENHWIRMFIFSKLFSSDTRQEKSSEWRAQEKPLFVEKSRAVIGCKKRPIRSVIRA